MFDISLQLILTLHDIFQQIIHSVVLTILKDNISKFRTACDFYIVCLQQGGIKNWLCQKLQKISTLVIVHTSSRQSFSFPVFFQRDQDDSMAF